MNITDGRREYWNVETGQTRESLERDGARRVYDRLRKRSYRRVFSREGYMAGWSGDDHIAYVAGVRDALNEILG